MLTQLVCVPVARTEMFTYNVTVCDRSQTTTKYEENRQKYLLRTFPYFRYKVVTWENEELKEVNSKAHYLGATWLLQFEYTRTT